MASRSVHESSIGGDNSASLHRWPEPTCDGLLLALLRSGIRGRPATHEAAAILERPALRLSRLTADRRAARVLITATSNG